MFAFHFLPPEVPGEAEKIRAALSSQAFPRLLSGAYIALMKSPDTTVPATP
jgi:hypothetical protein